MTEKPTIVVVTKENMVLFHQLENYCLHLALIGNSYPGLIVANL